ncbi:MBL fold metallo-hydrolase [Candidatus Micrarchaeota archaeon]|nr:MBL fold metallo-hydrolase [Candidatus Micrarchaeota archaeon]
MTSLTFFGGVKEIGGNKILLEDRKTRIFLDFGQSFSLLDDYFVPESYLSPRDRFGLRDYFEFGLIPKLNGLYSDEAIEHTDLKASEPGFDGVFISHAHFDHVAHLEYLHPGIPIYMGETAKKILDSNAETTSNRYFAEGAEIRQFRSGQEISVGDLKVTPIHVDHSVPGAYGFLVETSEGVVAYTGDLRQHGPRGDMTREFVQRAKEAEPEALIIEGTRVFDVEKRKNYSEESVKEESKKVIHESDRLVLAMRYPKDLDRFRTFHDIAKESGRKLVTSMKTAHLLQSLKDDPLGLSDPFKDKHIEVYCRKMKTYKKWEKPMMDDCVDSGYIHDNQKELIFELDFWQLTELVDVRPSGGECIHSMSEPFEEDPMSQVSDDVLENWLEHFGMRRHQLHASGHASKSEIFEIVKEIDAKKVFPVHTMNPGMFGVACRNTEVTEKGRKCEI